ncbi:Hypothetical predicted protein [Octopus vulgaris]|uniref:Uncharacterized protein n=1 Tax=Octopus vulgaris TaxID=6645 RepID=A0AA36AUX0_OCTVU|nr:Hypothetical predicted protein [Octopus vulgaris]
MLVAGARGGGGYLIPYHKLITKMLDKSAFHQPQKTVVSLKVRLYRLAPIPGTGTRGRQASLNKPPHTQTPYPFNSHRGGPGHNESDLAATDLIAGPLIG